MKFEKQYRKDLPETLGETDKDFDRNQKRLNAIKEVIQWIDSGKQGLNNGMEEIDFIVNEWNYGETE